MNTEHPKKIFSKDLGINLESRKETEIFKWFLACLLFGKPIQQEVAKRTYFEFVKHKLVTPQKIIDAGWDKLVKVLDEGHYVRFDFSTADKLLAVCKMLHENYGTLEKLYKAAENKKDLIDRLEEFKGVGPKTVEIFLRDMHTIWPKAK
jgi:endonuclease III